MANTVIQPSEYAFTIRAEDMKDMAASLAVLPSDPGFPVVFGPSLAGRCRPAGVPNQRADLLFQEDGGALPTSCPPQHGVRPAGCQLPAQTPHHPERCHIPG